MLKTKVRDLALLLLLWLAGNLPFAWARDAGGNQACKPLPETLTIDQVWGGTRIGFDALATNDFIYTGYYDNDRLAYGKAD